MERDNTNPKIPTTDIRLNKAVTLFVFVNDCSFTKKLCFMPIFLA